jgi:hypothetical protein
MGYGAYSVDATSARLAYQEANKIDPFAYSDSMRYVSYADRKAHDDLNPLGVKLRESRDSAEHPNAVAIGCFFDQTGSMGDGPRQLQKKLPELFGTILRRGYIEDPQILMGAIGDAHMGEAAPLQAGQFESDNRIDTTLENIYLEGMGGGNRGESYGLALYFMARHTSIDCWEKRDKKGYLFLTGDECPLSVTRQEVKTYIGDDIESDLTIEEVVREAQRTYEVFFLHVRTGASEHQGSLAVWQKLLGDHVIPLQSLDTICETIALTIGLMEGTLDSLDEGADHLREAGADRSAIASATKSLAVLAKGRTDVATGSSSDTLPSAGNPDAGGTRRL